MTAPDAARTETTQAGPVPNLSELDRRLLDAFQRDFPITPRPYAELARRLDTEEETVIARLEHLRRLGFVSRVGAVVAPHKAGWSTLAAMAVPEARLDEVAGLVSGFAEVNHNYEREHRLNLWFVVTGADAGQVAAVLQDIEARSGLAVLDLPLVEAYRLDLGFPLQWT
jgi:DNA-binding Lrp family transcriptional regulator